MTEIRTRKSRGTMRPIAGRQEILAAASSIGLSLGWKAVTIRAVAQRLGYTAPLLYEHFKDNPHGFEYCAARLAGMMDPNVNIETITRPSVDGGRDAIRHIPRRTAC